MNYDPIALKCFYWGLSQPPNPLKSAKVYVDYPSLLQVIQNSSVYRETSSHTPFKSIYQPSLVVAIPAFIPLLLKTDKSFFRQMHDSPGEKTFLQFQLHQVAYCWGKVKTYIQSLLQRSLEILFINIFTETSGSIIRQGVKIALGVKPAVLTFIKVYDASLSQVIILQYLLLIQIFVTFPSRLFNIQLKQIFPKLLTCFDISQHSRLQSLTDGSSCRMKRALQLCQIIHLQSQEKAVVKAQSRWGRTLLCVAFKLKQIKYQFLSLQPNNIFKMNFLLYWFQDFQSSYLQVIIQSIQILILIMRGWKRIVDDNYKWIQSQLILDKKGISDTDLITIMEICSKFIMSMKIFSLCFNKIGPEGAKTLSEQNFSNLRILMLNENKILAKGVKYLIRSNFSQLTNLSLSENNIGVQGVKYIVNENFRDLKVLNLNGNKINSQGIKHLMNGSFDLIQLYLSSNSIGGNGAKYLASGKFNSLKQLSLYWSQIQGLNSSQITKILTQMCEISLYI